LLYGVTAFVYAVVDAPLRPREGPVSASDALHCGARRIAVETS